MMFAIHAKIGGYVFIAVIGSFARITFLSIGLSFVYLALVALV